MEFNLNDGIPANPNPTNGTNGTNGQSATSPSVWGTNNKTDHTFVEVSTRNAFYKKRPSRRKLEIFLIGALIVAIILIAVLVYMCIQYYKVSNKLDSICRTPECIHSASSMLNSMDPTVEPCDDFYQFACGRFNNEHPIPETSLSTDWFSERSDRALAKVKEYLQRNDSESDPIPTVQARIMYAACTNTDKLEELGLEPLRMTLEQMELPLVPPTDESEYGNKTSINKLLALVKVTIGKDIILHSGVYADVYNRTRNKITIATPEEKSILPSHMQRFSHMQIHKSEKHISIDARLVKALTSGTEHIVNAWKRYVTVVIEYFMKKSDVTGVSPEALQETATNILLITTKIRQIVDNDNITKGSLENPTKMNINSLQQITDEAVPVDTLSKIDWYEYLTNMFSYYNETVDIEERELAVYSIEYYKAISQLLATHSEYEIMLAVWWDVVFTLIPYTNEELRTIRSTFLTEALGEPSPRPRESHCSSNVWKLMDIALAGGVAEDISFPTLKADIMQMIDYLQKSFTHYVTEATWMDLETRLAILDKAKYIRRNIGFPEWITNVTLVEEYYDGLEVSEDTHMENFLNVVQIAVKTMLLQLDTDNSYANPDFDPREVNAIYIPQENSISIPLAILQFPFYNLGIDALNYGALGTIIGHELTHAFDTTGRKYDKHGNVKDWWSNFTIDNYNERVDCFISMYDDYFVIDADQYLDGNLTLGENIADNGGVKDAFNGYKKMREKSNKPELNLPGLEKYTNDQLFFISFAHQWCENWTPQSLKYGLADEHSPNFIRVLATASNLEDFSKAWNCAPDSRMNKKRKCKLW